MEFVSKSISFPEPLLFYEFLLFCNNTILKYRSCQQRALLLISVIDIRSNDCSYALLLSQLRSNFIKVLTVMQLVYSVDEDTHLMWCEIMQVLIVFVILLSKLRFDQISCSARSGTCWQYKVPKWYGIVKRLRTPGLREVRN